jgi:hypothetical protein
MGEGGDDFHIARSGRCADLPYIGGCGGLAQGLLGELLKGAQAVSPQAHLKLRLIRRN